MDNYIARQENKTVGLDLAKEMQLMRNHMLYFDQLRQQDQSKHYNDLFSLVKSFIDQASAVEPSPEKSTTEDIEIYRKESKALEQKFGLFVQQVLNSIACYGNMLKEGRDEYLNIGRRVELLIQEISMKKLMISDK